MLFEKASILRPMSCITKLNTSAIFGVNLRMHRFSSRNNVWTSVLTSRLSMSLLSTVSSEILSWYSALTVYSSSLTECNSSLVLCSSSLDATSSSLVACSSSLLVSSSSIVDCRFSLV